MNPNRLSLSAWGLLCLKPEDTVSVDLLRPDKILSKNSKKNIYTKSYVITHFYFFSKIPFS